MAVISAADYLDIATFYANAKSQVTGAKQFFFDAVYEIVLLNQVKPEVDLLQPFWDSYLINTDLLEASTMFLSAVRALQQHVLIEGNYDDIDSYLSANGIQVPQVWADLSAEAGFTIAVTNIA